MVATVGKRAIGQGARRHHRAQVDIADSIIDVSVAAPDDDIAGWTPAGEDAQPERVPPTSIVHTLTVPLLWFAI